MLQISDGWDTMPALRGPTVLSRIMGCITEQQKQNIPNTICLPIKIKIIVNNIIINIININIIIYILFFFSPKSRSVNLENHPN